MILDHPEILTEVEAHSDLYEAALAANDLERLDALFWNDPRTVRFGQSETLYGMDAIRAFRAARPPSGAKRDNLRREIVAFGVDHAVCQIEFSQASSGRLGRQSQVWVRIEGQWKITAAHISLRAE